jgi:hypothetical protein
MNLCLVNALNARSSNKTFNKTFPLFYNLLQTHPSATLEMLSLYLRHKEKNDQERALKVVGNEN